MKRNYYKNLKEIKKLNEKTYREEIKSEISEISDNIKYILSDIKDDDTYLDLNYDFFVINSGKRYISIKFSKILLDSDDGRILTKNGAKLIMILFNTICAYLESINYRLSFPIQHKFINQDFFSSMGDKLLSNNINEFQHHLELISSDNNFRTACIDHSFSLQFFKKNYIGFL